MQKRLTVALFHSNCTYEDSLFIQLCSDPTTEHCNTVQGKMQSPLLTAALQDRLAAGLHHCNYTYEDLLVIQLCSDPSPMHCNTGSGMHSHCSLLLCKTGLQQACITAITPMKICWSYSCAVTHHQCTATLVLECTPTAHCCSARQACSRLASLQLHL